MKQFVAVLYYTRLASPYWAVPLAANPIMISLGNLGHLSSFCVQAIFVTLLETCSLLFQFLNQKIEEENTKKNQKYYRLSTELEKWRREYDKICFLIEKIDHAFGIVLLISLIQVAIGCTKSSYITILYSIQRDDRWKANLLVLLAVSSRFFVLLTALHRMQLQVLHY